MFAKKYHGKDGGNTSGIYAILEQGIRGILLPVIPKGPYIRHVSALLQARRGLQRRPRSAYYRHFYEQDVGYSDGRDPHVIAAPTRQDVGTNHPTTTVTAEIRRDRRSDKQDVGTNHPTTTATDEIRVRSPLLQARRGHEPSHYKSLVSCLVRVHASSNAPGEFLILA